MVFYVGRAPNGTKTSWKMNEYKAIELGEASSSIQPQVCVSLPICICIIFLSSN